MLRYKHPRIPHLPDSPGSSTDDVRRQVPFPPEEEVVVTEKMDGENTTIYPDGFCHARSVTPSFHPSRSWVRRYAAEIAWTLPRGWRLCGENLYAEHSLPYRQLASYFLIFSVWDEHNVCRSWQETEAFARQRGIALVPVLYQGLWGDFVPQLDLRRQEGYVVRLAGEFPYEKFEECVAKWVRPNHVQTSDHWLNQPLRVNGVSSKAPDDK